MSRPGSELDFSVSQRLPVLEETPFLLDTSAAGGPELSAVAVEPAAAGTLRRRPSVEQQLSVAAGGEACVCGPVRACKPELEAVRCALRSLPG